MREIVFDTETTGLNDDRKDRVVEIAAVEIIDGKRTGNTFRSLVNPQRLIPVEVQRIHGISDADVVNAPLFRVVWGQFLEFVNGSRLIAHNSGYDEMMVDQELRLMGQETTLRDHVEDIQDTLRLSKRVFPEAKIKHNLDAVLDRLEIDRSTRTLHSALLDCELLADAYLEMERRRKLLPPRLNEEKPRAPVVRLPTVEGLRVVMATAEDIAADAAYMAPAAKKNPAP